MQRFEFNLYAAYHSIQFADGGEPPDGSVDAICEITDEDLYRRMKVVPGIVVMYTARFKESPLVVELLDGEPEPDFTGWDHVVECSLDITSGVIEVSVLWGGGGTIETPPDGYRVRASQAKLDSVTDPDGEGDDHYLVQFWPASEIELSVLKQYTRPV